MPVHTPLVSPEFSFEPDHFAAETLAAWKKAGRGRKLPPLAGAPGPRIRIGGREVVLLCSNNYLGLAGDPRVKRAAQEAVERYGCGATGSRLVSGNSELYELLERELAAFKGTEAALVFPTGYQANVGTVAALAGPRDAVFTDAMNHASLFDGARLSGARVVVYRHGDAEDLERKLRCRAAARRKLVLTESVFSMDGDLAPLRELTEVARRHGALLMVDEAHATGVFGPNGAGKVEELGLQRRVDLQMGTFSKALGSLGGYIVGNKELIAYLLHTARSFVYTTGLPPAVLAASREALRIVREEPERRGALWRNVAQLRSGIEGAKLALGPSESQILPVLLNDERRAVAASRWLLRRGIFVQAIRPPTVPEGTARLRVSPMATHSSSDIEQAVSAFAELQQRLVRAKGQREAP